MQTDRFKKYDNDVRKAVLRFEKMQRTGNMGYIDVSDMEMVIDFYFDSDDLEQLDSAIRYGEQLYPSSNMIKLRRAHYCCVMDQPNKALDMLKEIDKLEPGNTDVMYALGIVYSQLDQPQKSIQYFQLASADCCELGMVYGNIGDEYCKLENFPMAIKYFKKAINADPEEERSQYNLLSVLEDTGATDEAVSYFLAKVQDHPYNLNMWICLGAAYSELGLLEKAIDAFEYALIIDKTHFQTYVLLSDCYRKANNPAKAVSALHESLDYAEDRSWVYYSMGMIYGGAGNFASAIVYLKKAADEDPYFGDAWWALGSCYAEQGDYHSAIEMTERAISINPRSSAYMMQAASLYSKLGNNEVADNLFQCMLHIDGEQDENHLVYADFLMDCGRYNDAIEVLNKGIINASNQASFNLRLAVCYFKTGRRNFLYNVLRSCIDDTDCDPLEMMELCPEMFNDPEVAAIIKSS